MSSKMALSNPIAPKDPEANLKNTEELLQSVQQRIAPADLSFMIQIRDSKATFPTMDPRFALFELWNGLKQELQDKNLSG